MPSLSDCSTNEIPPGEIAELLEAAVKPLLGGSIQAFELIVGDGGIVLHGIAHSYYAKQQAQYAVMHSTRTPILSNDIAVVRLPARSRINRD